MATDEKKTRPEKLRQKSVFLVDDFTRRTELNKSHCIEFGFETIYRHRHFINYISNLLVMGWKHLRNSKHLIHFTISSHQYQIETHLSEFKCAHAYTNRPFQMENDSEL